MKVVNLYEVNTTHQQELERWTWLQSDFGSGVDWLHYSNKQFPRLEKWVRRPRFVRYWMALVGIIRGWDADLIVTHNVHLAATIGFLNRITGSRLRHLAWAFSIPDVQKLSLLRRWFYQFGLRNVDQFVMFSNMETSMYANLLSLPLDRFQMIHWTSGGSKFQTPSYSPFEFEYIAAIGGEGRDYATLFSAMRHLPTMKLVVVASPKSVQDLTPPDNVTLLVDQPAEFTYQIANHSQFMVLPLTTSDTPCGHSSLVAQFLMRKATIVTASEAMTDYIEPEKNAWLYQAGDVVSLLVAIKTLASDQALRKKLSRNSEAFAQEHCSEGKAIDFVRTYFETIKNTGFQPVKDQRNLCSQSNSTTQC